MRVIEFVCVCVPICIHYTYVYKKGPVTNHRYSHINLINITLFDPILFKTNINANIKGSPPTAGRNKYILHQRERNVHKTGNRL